MELEGRLSILGSEGVVCFRVLGHLRVSGSVSFQNCHGPKGNLVSAHSGGAIHSRNITVSNAGSLRIQNCSSDNGGGIFARSVLMDSGNSATGFFVGKMMGKDGKHIQTPRIPLGIVRFLDRISKPRRCGNIYKQSVFVEYIIVIIESTPCCPSHTPLLEGLVGNA